jgi:hypothetical protein
VRPNRKALEEFPIHGVKYAFPTHHGAMARGLPTSYAANPFANSSEQAMNLYQCGLIQVFQGRMANRNLELLTGVARLLRPMLSAPKRPVWKGLDVVSLRGQGLRVTSVTHGNGIFRVTIRDFQLLNKESGFL